MLNNARDAAAAANGVEEHRDRHLRTNRAAQWPVTMLQQLTAPLCCRIPASRCIRCLLYVHTPAVGLETPLSHSKTLCSTAGTFRAQPSASAFRTWGINRLWQASEHTPRTSQSSVSLLLWLSSISVNGLWLWKTNTHELTWQTSSRNNDGRSKTTGGIKGQIFSCSLWLTPLHLTWFVYKTKKCIQYKE